MTGSEYEMLVRTLDQMEAHYELYTDASLKESATEEERAWDFGSLARALEVFDVPDYLAELTETVVAIGEGWHGHVTMLFLFDKEGDHLAYTGGDTDLIWMRGKAKEQATT